MKLPLEVTYRVGVGFIEKKYYEVNAEDVARIFYDEFKRQQRDKEAETCSMQMYQNN